MAGWLEKPSNAGKEVVKVAAEEARLSCVMLIKSGVVMNVVCRGEETDDERKNERDDMRTEREVSMKKIYKAVCSERVGGREKERERKKGEIEKKRTPVRCLGSWMDGETVERVMVNE